MRKRTNNIFIFLGKKIETFSYWLQVLAIIAWIVSTFIFPLQSAPVLLILSIVLISSIIFLYFENISNSDKEIKQEQEKKEEKKETKKGILYKIQTWSLEFYNKHLKDNNIFNILALVLNSRSVAIQFNVICFYIAATIGFASSNIILPLTVLIGAYFLISTIIEYYEKNNPSPKSHLNKQVQFGLKFIIITSFSVISLVTQTYFFGLGIVASSITFSLILIIGVGYTVNKFNFQKHNKNNAKTELLLNTKRQFKQQQKNKTTKILFKYQQRNKKYKYKKQRKIYTNTQKKHLRRIRRKTTNQTIRQKREKREKREKNQRAYSQRKY